MAYFFFRTLVGETADRVGGMGMSLGLAWDMGAHIEDSVESLELVHESEDDTLSHKRSASHATLERCNKLSIVILGNYNNIQSRKEAS
ncbi:hypothetical protein EON65_57915 [archaeon]|nr:MAG: hypothetical protein EON65_57915 [archaeon]